MKSILFTLLIFAVCAKAEESFLSKNISRDFFATTNKADCGVVAPDSSPKDLKIKVIPNLTFKECTLQSYQVSLKNLEALSSESHPLQSQDNEVSKTIQGSSPLQGYQISASAVFDSKAGAGWEFGIYFWGEDLETKGAYWLPNYVGKVGDRYIGKIDDPLYDKHFYFGVSVLNATPNVIEITPLDFGATLVPNHLFVVGHFAMVLERGGERPVAERPGFHYNSVEAAEFGPKVIFRKGGFTKNYDLVISAGQYFLPNLNPSFSNYHKDMPKEDYVESRYSGSGKHQVVEAELNYMFSKRMGLNTRFNYERLVGQNILIDGVVTQPINVSSFMFRTGVTVRIGR